MQFVLRLYIICRIAELCLKCIYSDFVIHKKEPSGNMLDIHCHILPGIDDGSPDLETSVKMARAAAKSGVDTIIATPHCNIPGAAFPNYQSEELSHKLQELSECIQSENIPLKILPGAEILATEELPELLRSRKLPTLADSQYLLTEFYFDESPSFMDRIFRQIRAQGLIPVIAHPERYDAVQENPMLAADWFEAGYIIQVNKGSILGSLGEGAELTARWLIERGLVHAVASDAHGARHRTADMSEIFNELLRISSSEYADILLELNPRRIAANQPVMEA